MQLAHRLIPAIALAVLSATANASTITYSASAAFLARVLPGAYTETFTGLLNPPAGPFTFSGGSFSYNASAPNDLYLEGGFLGASQENDALTILFTSGNVHAVGANFFATDLGDAFQPVSITITLGDGTVETFTPASLADSYRGFASENLITSLVISGPGISLYAGLDNLTVGTVPEPTSWALVGLALSGLIVARRRSI